jgi:hypothetical protein
MLRLLEPSMGSVKCVGLLRLVIQKREFSFFASWKLKFRWEVTTYYLVGIDWRKR